MGVSPDELRRAYLQQDDFAFDRAMTVLVVERDQLRHALCELMVAVGSLPYGPTPAIVRAMDAAGVVLEDN